MPRYKIERWDAILPEGSEFPYPAIYVKPDAEFSKYIEENDYMLLLDIENTNSTYDARSVVGVASNSGYFPNFRPNFFNATGYYVIVLLTNWIGYPPSDGMVRLQGVKGPDAIVPPPTKEFEPPVPLEFYETPVQNNCDKLTPGQLIGLSSTILVLFILLIGIAYKNKKI